MKRSILILCLLFHMVAASAQWLGSGSSSDPYVIDDAYALEQLASSVNRGVRYDGTYFVLADDIDLGVAPYNENYGWIPIGTENTPFKGYFNGDGKVIRNLFVNDDAQDYAGLFGVADVNSGGLENITLENVNLTGGSYVGGVAGRIVALGGSTGGVTGCRVTGTINGTTSIGGVAGELSGGKVENCYAGVEIHGGDNYVGGVAGRISTRAGIANCIASGTVVSEGGYVGGVVGFLAAECTVANCYATCAVAGSERVAEWRVTSKTVA